MIDKTQSDITYYTIDEALGQVQDGITREFCRTPPVVRTYTEHLLKSQGKLLRTKSLLSCALNEDKLIHENAVCVSVGVEILHLATLVHDDIIDNAPTRRGLPTLQYQFGKKPAVICGDYLLCLALKIFSRIREKERYEEFAFPDYIGRLCGGELLQHENNCNPQLSVHSCLRIIRGKTAALFEGAFRAGGVFSGAGSREAADYAALGRFVGMIFQLTDDCLDYVSAEQAAQKPVQSDFEQGVITLPLVYALSQRPEIKKRIAAGSIGKDEILALVDSCHGVDFTRSLAKRYYDKAEALLRRMELPEEKRGRLLAILDQSYHGVLGKGTSGDQRVS